jgi:K+-sensing histidine kinase KdpD
MKKVITPSRTAQDNPEFVTVTLPKRLLHDIMQPLNSYGLANEHLKSVLKPLLEINSSFRASWELMDNAIQTQATLLGKLRQFWHLQNNQTIPDFYLVSLAPIATRICTHPIFTKLDKELKVFGFEDFCVISNTHHLSDILACLVENAAIHAVSSITVKAYACPEGVQIDVIDDGPGLPEEIMESLGVPFTQPSRSRGLGLGIYIAAATASMLEHKLEVENLQSGGCSFSLTIAKANADSLRP